MRLLEPINGIKVAQGHMIIHLVFFATMFTFDKNENPDDEQKVREIAIFDLKKWGHFSCFIF